VAALVSTVHSVVASERVGKTDFSLYRSLVYVVDVAGVEPPTFYSLTDLRRHACYTVREIPLECRFGADLWFHETRASALAREAFCSADFMMTGADTQKPPPRKGYFQPRWPLRGAGRSGGGGGGGGDGGGLI
jgi:hypothetical protein